MTAHPDIDKHKDSILCPFSFDYPYILTSTPGWQAPDQFMESLPQLKNIE
ncbi:MAG: hypothetical protein Q7R79_02800 [bacterium]|nr:hypothetical protein [bacterium]